MAVMPSARKAAAAAAPPAPPGTPQPPAAVPRSAPAPPPEPDAPPPAAYKTYSTRTPQRASKPAAKPAEPKPEPAPAAAVAGSPPAAAAPPSEPAAPPPVAPGAALPGDPPPPPRRSPGAAIGDGFRNLDRRVYAILAAIVIGGALVFGIAVLGGKSKDKVPPEPTQAAAVVTTKSKPKKTPTPKPAAAPALKTQAQEIDRLLKLSQTGRAAAVKGDFKAATANRAKLLKDLQSLQGKATDAQLKAGVTAFAAAIRESLRQNRECGSKCSTSDITKVGTLKQTALDKLNPLLKRFGLGPYTIKQI